MTEILTKLAAWHQLHMKLQEARLRLQQAPVDSAFDRSQLQEEVSRLQGESDCVLQALNQSPDRGNPPASGSQRAG